MTKVEFEGWECIWAKISKECDATSAVTSKSEETLLSGGPWCGNGQRAE